MTKFEEKKREAYEKASMKSYGNTAGSMQMRHLLNELENAGLLKEQQALPVVPEYVAKDVKRLSLSTLADWNVAVSYISKETLEWLSTTGNINVFLGKSWTLCSLKINGFKVEKQQLFYLREKNTNYYLNKSKNNGLELVPNPYFDEDNQFTQQEIDSMETGSYEKIEVEK